MGCIRHGGVTHGGHQGFADLGAAKYGAQSLGDFAEEHRKQDCGAQGATNLAEERGRAGCNAQIACLDGVLCGNGQRLHQHAQPQTDDDHSSHQEAHVTVLINLRQPAERHHQQACAHHQKWLVAAGARNELPADCGGRHHAQHHWNCLESALCGGGPQHQLQEQGDGHHGAKHGKADEDSQDGQLAERAGPEQAQRDNRILTHGLFGEDEPHDSGRANAVTQQRLE